MVPINIRVVILAEILTSLFLLKVPRVLTIMQVLTSAITTRTARMIAILTRTLTMETSRLGSKTSTNVCPGRSFVRDLLLLRFGHFSVFYNTRSI